MRTRILAALLLAVVGIAGCGQIAGHPTARDRRMGEALEWRQAQIEKEYNQKIAAIRREYPGAQR